MWGYGLKIYKRTSWACMVAVIFFCLPMVGIFSAGAEDGGGVAAAAPASTKASSNPQGWSIDPGWQENFGKRPADEPGIAAAKIVSEKETSEKTEEFEKLDSDSSCDGSAKSAQYVCDPMSAVLGRGEGAMLEMVLMQGGSIATNMMNSGKSAYEQCTSAKNLAKIMGMIQGARAVACGIAQKKCVSRCGTVREHLEVVEKAPNQGVDFDELKKKARKNISNCKEYETNFAMQLFQVMNYASTYFGAGKCQKETKLADSTPPPFPTAVPVDCTNAETLRTNPLCLCQRSPRDPLCVGAPRPPSGPGQYTSVDDGPGGSFEPPPLLPGDGDGAGPVAGGPPGGGDGSGAKSGGVPQQGGGGPTNPFGGGGGGGGPRAGVEGSSEQGSSGYNTGVISGVSGGGTFAGYGKGGGAAGEGRDGNGNLMKALKDRFNLKDALPDKDKLARGLAGMSAGAAADGITGANGPSIWEKVSRQYQKKKAELLGPR